MGIRCRYRSMKYCGSTPALRHAINPINGNRQILTDNSGSFLGPALGSPTDLIFDDRDDANPANDRVLVKDGLAILVVQKDTGAKSILSDNSSTSTADFVQPRGLALDKEGDNLLVYDVNDPEINIMGRIHEVALNSGVRSLLSIDPIDFPSNSSAGLVLDDTNKRAFAVSRQLQAIIIIDLQSGESAIMSK